MCYRSYLQQSRPSKRVAEAAATPSQSNTPEHANASAAGEQRGQATRRVLLTQRVATNVIPMNWLNQPVATFGRLDSATHQYGQQFWVAKAPRASSIGMNDMVGTPISDHKATEIQQLHSGM